MGTLAVALVIVVAVIAASSLALLVLRRRRAAAFGDVSVPVHPHAPLYRRQAQHTDYYRPLETKESSRAHPSVTERHRPREERLPHCPLCNAAVGFDDVRCPKCRHDLKDF
jgi:hypothetical protein